MITALPECAAPNLCECCGVKPGTNFVDPGTSTLPRWRWLAGSWFNIDCYHELDRPGYSAEPGGQDDAFFDRIRARRAAQTPPVTDRPIQAGDWVECVEQDSQYLTEGARYQVDCIVGTCFFLRLKGVLADWKQERFKRVDGPHPSSSVLAGTGNAQSSGTGEPLYEPGDPRAHSYCKECGVTVAGPRCEFPLCARCTARRAKHTVYGIDWAQGALCSTPECAARSVMATHGTRCIYCHDTDRRDDFETMMDMTREPGDREAGNRLAAMSRAEALRGNRADAVQFAKPHVWEEFE